MNAASIKTAWYNIQSCQQVTCCKSKSSHKSFLSSLSQVTSHLMQTQVKSKSFSVTSNSSQVTSHLVAIKSSASHTIEQQSAKPQFIMKDHLQHMLSEFNHINRIQKKLWRYIRSANM